MKYRIDMNLAPDWIEVLTKEGWEAVHLSSNCCSFPFHVLC